MDFLWHNNEGDQKFYLMNWNSTFQPLSEGGLGVRPLGALNRALVSKWLWHFFGEERDKLWRKIIVT